MFVLYKIFHYEDFRYGFLIKDETLFKGFQNPLEPWNIKSFFKQKIEISPQFFSIFKKSMPINKVHLEELQKDSSLSCSNIDLYLFCVYRMYSQKSHTPIPWASLKNQFGFEQKNLKSFIQYVKLILIKIQRILKQFFYRKKDIFAFFKQGFVLINENDTCPVDCFFKEKIKKTIIPLLSYARRKKK